MRTTGRILQLKLYTVAFLGYGVQLYGADYIEILHLVQPVRVQGAAASTSITARAGDDQMQIWR
eukprot:SAG31_NODE_15772_length_739_cov_1.295313_1_plen_64_part_00